MHCMRLIHFALAATIAGAPLVAPAQVGPDPAYVKQIRDYRERAEKSLRADNGWLTLAGRYILKTGENTFGTGDRNDVVFPKGTGPIGMGSIFVEPDKADKVTVKMVPGLTLRSPSGSEYTERVMSTNLENRDWVSVGRLAFHIIEREGKYILRLADNESEVRKRFGGRAWYDIDEGLRLKAKYVPYDPPRKEKIVNILDEVSEETVPGYVEFDINGRTQRLDALAEDNELFIIFADATGGDTTYKPGRFLYVKEMPVPGKPFELDFNRAFNPPCAFSEFTTCPLPPKQNVLKVRIEGGEKYPPRKG
jgi:uncharacterized protein (DUF1684 family)